MSAVLQRGTAILAVIAASLVFATAGLAQMPPSPWKKGAPFPEPDEELYGVAVGGKLYVIGGWGEGKARGANYEYDPATDKWTKKRSMPQPAHHAALATYNGVNRGHPHFPGTRTWVALSFPHACWTASPVFPGSGWSWLPRDWGPFIPFSRDMARPWCRPSPCNARLAGTSRHSWDWSPL